MGGWVVPLKTIMRQSESSHSSRIILSPQHGQTEYIGLDDPNFDIPSAWILGLQNKFETTYQP